MISYQFLHSVRESRFHHLSALLCGGALVLFTTIVFPLVASAALPTPWQSDDVGGPPSSGSATFSNTTFTVAGTGDVVPGAHTDSFRFTYVRLIGDGEIIARVEGISSSQPWAKAGVMIRENLNSNSTHAMTVITNNNQALFTWRRRTGSEGYFGQNFQVSRTAGPPRYVRISRKENYTYSAISSDGVNWISIGEQQLIPVGAQPYIGLVVMNANVDDLNTAQFTHVQIKNPIPPLCGTAHGSADKGKPPRTSLCIPGAVPTEPVNMGHLWGWSCLEESTGTISDCMATGMLACPYAPRTGRDIAVFQKGLHMGYTSRQSTDRMPITNPLPNGTYNIHLTSWDAYGGRENSTQDDERWRIKFYDADGAPVASSLASTELPDLVQEAYVDELLPSSVTLSTPVTQVQGWHRNVDDTPSSETWGSLVAICAAIDRDFGGGPVEGDLNFTASEIGNPSNPDNDQNQITIPYGEKARLTWDTENVETCEAITTTWPEGLGVRPPNGTEDTAPLYVNTSYTMRCYDNNGNIITSAVTVFVDTPGSSSLSGVGCRIQENESTCNGRLSWFIVGPDPRIINELYPAVSLYTTPQSTNQPHSLVFGNTVFRSYSGLIEQNTLILRAQCQEGLEWDLGLERCVNLPRSPQ